MLQFGVLLRAVVKHLPAHGCPLLSSLALHIASGGGLPCPLGSSDSQHEGQGC